MPAAKSKQTAEDAKYAERAKRSREKRFKADMAEHAVTLKFLEKHPIVVRGVDGKDVKIDVKAADLILSFNLPDRSKRERCRDEPYGAFTLYFVEGDEWGWCVCTLPIASQSRGPQRTYGWKLANNSEVRMGAGPHVLKTLQIQRYTDRVAALKPLHDAWSRGLHSASFSRDQLSTRRLESRRRRSLW